MFKLKIDGLDDVMRKLDRLASNAQTLHGKHQIPLQDILTSEFLQKHTPFQSVQEMFDKSQFKITSKEDLEAIPEELLDAYIKANTKFSTWNDMLTAAATEMITKKLFS